MSNINEIKNSVKILKKHQKYHSASMHKRLPAPYEDLNLGYIDILRKN